MANKNKNINQNGGVNINGGKVKVGHDVIAGEKTGRDKIGGDKVGRDMITMGDVSIRDSFNQWQAAMERTIDAQKNLSADDKKDAKETVAKIQTEATKGPQADPTRLERFVNRLAEMGPDIFEVALATLANPLAGIGLVVKKIADKAKVERLPAGK